MAVRVDWPWELTTGIMRRGRDLGVVVNVVMMARCECGCVFCCFGGENKSPKLDALCKAAVEYRHPRTRASTQARGTAVQNLWFLI